MTLSDKNMVGSDTMTPAQLAAHHAELDARFYKIVIPVAIVTVALAAGSLLLSRKNKSEAARPAVTAPATTATPGTPNHP